MSVPGNDFTFGWEYLTNESVDINEASRSIITAKSEMTPNYTLTQSDSIRM